MGVRSGPHRFSDFASFTNSCWFAAHQRPPSCSVAAIRHPAEMTDGPECALCFDSVQVDGTGEEDRLAMLNYLAGLPALSVSLAGLPALSWFISVIARDGVSLHLIAKLKYCHQLH